MVLSRTAALAEPILARKDERRLIEEWKAGRSDMSLDRITRAYFRVCYNIAAYYTSNESHLEELAQEGTFGIRRALDEFDFSYGTKFSTFVRRYVQNAIADEVSTVEADVTIPARAFLDARAGRSNPVRYAAAHAAIATSSSLDAPISGDEGQSFSDIFPDSAPNPAELVERSSQQEHYRALIARALGVLDDRERMVMMRRHLLDPVDTLEEIGNDLGVTRERVRQIEAGCMDKIRRHLSVRHGSHSGLF